MKIVYSTILFLLATSASLSEGKGKFFQKLRLRKNRGRNRGGSGTGTTPTGAQLGGGPGAGGGRQGAGGGQAGSAFAGTNMDTIPIGEKTDNDIFMMKRMRQEEKLARDVYNTLADMFEDVAVFSNIARAEQKHMDTMLAILQRYNVADRVVGNPGVGLFGDDAVGDEFEDMYQTLIAVDPDDLKAALEVGVFIEESDIADLQDAIDTTDEVLLQTVYGNLKGASTNHLRAFQRQLDRFF